MAYPTQDRHPITRLARTTPNVGGRITRGGATTNYAPSPYKAAQTPTGVLPNQPAPSAVGLTRTPNAGGSITRSGATTNFAPSPYVPEAARPNSGGTMTRAGANYVVPPSPAGAYSPAVSADVANQPAVQPTAPAPNPPPPQQTEAVNPLTNSGSAPKTQLAGTTQDVNPGQAMGFSQRGATVPQGQDAMPSAPGEHMAGSGLYARKFGNKRSADLYGDYIRKIFGADDGI